MNATRPADRHQEKSLLRARIEAVLHLVTGNVGNGVVMVGSLALATRALGPSDFGLLAMALAVGRVCERVIRFETWQPLVRFIAEEENASDEPERLSRLYLFGLVLDIAGAVVAGFLTLAVAAILVAFFDFASILFDVVTIYACAIALNLRGMASAVLRMAGMFRTMAYIVFVAGFLRLFLALVFYLAGGELLTFMAIWTVSQIVDALLFNFIAFRQLARQGTPSPLRARVGNLVRDFPGFLGFGLMTNASSALRAVTHEADTLLVGALTDSSSAGFYHLAKRMAKVAMQCGEMVQTVIYPDLARMWVGKVTGRFRKMIVGIQAALAAITLTMLAGAILAGRPVIGLVFGQAFLPAYPILIAQLIAVFLILHSAPARSALLAMNRPTLVLATAAVSTALFLAVAAYAIPMYGAVGASFAHIAFGLLTAVLLDFVMWRHLNRKAKAGAPVSSP